MSLRKFSLFGSSSVINGPRPPTYTKKPVAAPTYSRSVCDRTAPAGNGSFASTWSIGSPDSDSVFDQPADTDSSIMGTSVDIAGYIDITKPAGPRYVYYRLYTEDGAIPSINHVYSDDPYLGRILAELVAPPHIVMSLKHCLLSVENIDCKTMASLFLAASSQTPLDDTDRLSILATPGPGWQPNEPMAFLVNLSQSQRDPLEEKKPESVLLPTQEGLTTFETRYVYYRVYKLHGAVLSKHPADPMRPSVGRISIDSIPPPHTAQSIMRCISKIEEQNLSKNSRLFDTISSEFPIGDGHISILSADCPGSTPEDPLVFVVEPVMAIPSPAPVNTPTPDQIFSKRLRVIKEQVSDSRNPHWLTTTLGDILYATNAPPQPQPWVRPTGSLFQGAGQYLAYKVVNSVGKQGLVYQASCR